MKLLSVNVSKPREIIHNGKPVMTGIYKEPVEGRVMLRTLNLDGDQQADLKAHGGKYKAVYVYTYEHYAFWEKELGRDDLNMGNLGKILRSKIWRKIQSISAINSVLARHC